MPKEEMLPFCECNCGGRVTKPGNRFISGHNSRGKKHSEETKAKQRAAKLGTKQSAEHVANNCAARIGYKQSAEHIANSAAARIGYKHSSEAIVNMKVAVIKRYEDPEYCKKHKEACNTFEAKANYSAATSGENNPNYRDGKSENLYPSEFNEVLKEFIRNRDNRVCQLCDKTEELNGRRLTVHHIDHNKDNCSEYNLIALCHSCNVKVENREKAKHYQALLTEKLLVGAK